MASTDMSSPMPPKTPTPPAVDDDLAQSYAIDNAATSNVDSNNLAPMASPVNSNDRRGSADMSGVFNFKPMSMPKAPIARS
ncbi:hypothetical protein KEM55_004851, partial [Ascosphaera atra]